MTTRATIPAYEPGIYRGMPSNVYHALDCASSSRLKLLSKSPLHLRSYLDHGSEDTAATIAGRAIHCAMLEPHLFDLSFTVAAQCTAITGKGAPCANNGARFHLELGWLCGVHSKSVPATWDDSRTVLSPDDDAMCRGLREAAEAHPALALMLEEVTDRELSVVWDDKATGVRVKGRFDAYSPTFANGTIIDLKSCLDASKDAFSRTVFARSYHAQAALYLDAAAALGLPAENYAIVAMEKSRPWAVAVYRLAESALMLARDDMQRALRVYRDCRDRDEWPGYSNRIEDISLPAWAFTHRDLIGAFA